MADMGAHAGHRHVPASCSYYCTYLCQQCHLSPVQALQVNDVLLFTLYYKIESRKKVSIKIYKYIFQ